MADFNLFKTQKCTDYEYFNCTNNLANNHYYDGQGDKGGHWYKDKGSQNENNDYRQT
jgi:hypothetical protein